MYETLKLDQESDVLWLTLNRPNSLNALNRKMVEELRDCFSNLAVTPSTRLVVLRGAGRAFCAGADLKEAGGVGDRKNRSVESTLEAQRFISALFVMMRRVPQVIIACVHGAACGGGFALALASDLRIAGQSARMNVAPIKIGLSGCDVGLSYFLPRMVGASIAAELLLTGKFIDAARAEKIGLVSQVVPDDQLENVARSVATEILNNSPVGVKLTKDGLNASLDAGSLEQVIGIEDRNQVMCATSGDFQEGVRAFLEKRSPKYAHK